MHPPFDCLFCRSTAGPFNRIEHPIPESLGNDDLTLDKGFVCDPCNQYFGSKIEQRVLAAPPFNIERTAQAIPKKKEKLASYHENDLSPYSTGSTNTFLVVSPGNHEKTWEKISNGFIVPKEPLGYDSLLVRFFLKVGLEILSMVEDGDPYSPLFDAARRCARFGEGSNEWDIAWGIYPRRQDLHISSRYDEFGRLDTLRYINTDLAGWPAAM